MPKEYSKQQVKELWDKDYHTPNYWQTRCSTPAILALCNKQYHVLEWLENEYGVTKHKEIFGKQDEVFAKKHNWEPEIKRFETMDYEFARTCLGNYHFED